MKTESRPRARGDFSAEASEDFFSFAEEPEWDFDDSRFEDFASVPPEKHTIRKKDRK
jgi:hypothetical protein